MIAAVGVVVPVHNEEELLPRCLRALTDAIEQTPLPVHVVLVLDACTDGSAAVARAARRHGLRAEVVAIDRRSVGAARALGAAVAIRRLGADGTWLATTDADSAVGPGWLAGQLRYAGQGYAAVAGTVVIDDWTPFHRETRAEYELRYSAGWDHRHVHGANLGVNAETYLDVGGFLPRPTDEDVSLVQRIMAAGHQIAWADDLPVHTSGRVVGRAPAGMSYFLRSISQRTQAAAL